MTIVHLFQCFKFARSQKNLPAICSTSAREIITQICNNKKNLIEDRKKYIDNTTTRRTWRKMLQHPAANSSHVCPNPSDATKKVLVLAQGSRENTRRQCYQNFWHRNPKRKLSSEPLRGQPPILALPKEAWRWWSKSAGTEETPEEAAG